MNRALLVLLSCAVAACTTMRSVPLSGPPSGAPPVVAGDRIRVTKKDGEVLSLEVGAVTPTTIAGKTESGQSVEVALDDVGQLAVRHSAPGRTVALIALAATGATLWAVHQLAISLSF